MYFLPFWGFTYLKMYLNAPHIYAWLVFRARDPFLTKIVKGSLKPTSMINCIMLSKTGKIKNREHVFPIFLFYSTIQFCLITCMAYSTSYSSKSNTLSYSLVYVCSQSGISWSVWFCSQTDSSLSYITFNSQLAV